jgi:hypothetical protein
MDQPRQKQKDKEEDFQSFAVERLPLVTVFYSPLAPPFFVVLPASRDWRTDTGDVTSHNRLFFTFI